MLYNMFMLTGRLFIYYQKCMTTTTKKTPSKSLNLRGWSQQISDIFVLIMTETINQFHTTQIKNFEYSDIT